MQAGVCLQKLSTVFNFFFWILSAEQRKIVLFVKISKFRVGVRIKVFVKIQSHTEINHHKIKELSEIERGHLYSNFDDRCKIVDVFLSNFKNLFHLQYLYFEIMKMIHTLIRKRRVVK